MKFDDEKKKKEWMKRYTSNVVRPKLAKALDLPEEEINYILNADDSHEYCEICGEELDIGDAKICYHCRITENSRG